jgi:hypothetical protein
MYKPMPETAKQAALKATKLVLEKRYPGTIWRVLREGETPSGPVFRFDAPNREA